MKIGKLVNLEGKMFGRLKVIKRVENIGKEVVWLCECQCEKKNKLNIRARLLLHGNKKCCGCTKEIIYDLSCLKFNHWTVIEYVGKSESRNSLWICECDCDHKTRSIITDTNLKQGSSKSCGCQNKRNTTHGKSRSKNKLDVKIYKAWSNMKDRCFNENNESFCHYGGRGIIVCNEWLDKETGFINFYNWSTKNGADNDLTIDRIDNNGYYAPDNCRWVDFKTQENNKSNNRYITYNGKTQTLTLWSEEFNMLVATLKARLDSGWNIHDALNKEIKSIN